MGVYRQDRGGLYKGAMREVSALLTALGILAVLLLAMPLFWLLWLCPVCVAGLCLVGAVVAWAPGRIINK